ncbi:MAG: hypothetical protein ACUZ8H_06510 [Candidatus Anammoxibacter sp.]
MRTIIRFVVISIVSILFYQNFCQAQSVAKKYKYEHWKFLYEEKCSKCHTLDRVFTDLKTEKEWRSCITRMMRKNPLWITPEESSQIIEEIFRVREDVIVQMPQKKNYKDDRLLFIARCTRCHQVDRILNQNKTRAEWKETVLRMRDNAPELFFRGDIPVIANYLAERSHIMKDDVAAGVMVKRCLVCHEWGRILLVQKTKREWEKCVKDMRQIARKQLKKDWFTHDEFKIIVDLLVKTQGVETEG